MDWEEKLNVKHYSHLLKNSNRYLNFNKGCLRIFPYTLIFILLAITLWGSFYTVGQDEVGLVLRFGKYIKTTQPGLHLKIPFIDRVQKVPVQRQLKAEFGFRTIGVSGKRTSYRVIPEESLMLTGDLNACNVEWITQYRISDPYKYFYHVRNSRETFYDLNEAVMREIVGDRSVDEVLTIGRTEIESAMRTRLQALVNEYGLGIKVVQVVLQDVNPPERVKPAFNEVNEAQQEKERMINEAQAEYNKVIPRAKGEAKQMIEEARGYAIERINRAEGEVKRFNALFKEYLKAPEITRKRIFLETINKVMPYVREKIIIDSEIKGLIPFLDISPANSKMKTNGGK